MSSRPLVNDELASTTSTAAPAAVPTRRTKPSPPGPPTPAPTQCPSVRLGDLHRADLRAGLSGMPAPHRDGHRRRTTGHPVDGSPCGTAKPALVTPVIGRGSFPSTSPTQLVSS